MKNSPSPILPPSREELAHQLPAQMREAECVCDLPMREELLKLIEELPPELGEELWEEWWAVDPQLGHFNSAGGYCCPHYGNTCGALHWWEL